MATMTNRGDYLRAGEKREKPFIQMNSGACAPKLRTASQPITRHGHQEWKQQIDEEWQRHLETLRQCMSVLFLKNQPQRIGLNAVNEQGRRHRNATSL
jgi:hypothetical protein